MLILKIENKKLALVFLVVLIGMSVANLANATFAGGDGSPGNPFQIANCTDLQAMKDNLSASYILNNDIPCSETSTWNSCGTGCYYGFYPIGDNGDYDGPFTGSLDGNNHTINDLFIYNPTEDKDYTGLFGYTDSGSNIINVGLKNVNVEGHDNVGGLVGYGAAGILLIPTPQAAFLERWWL